TRRAALFALFLAILFLTCCMTGIAIGNRIRMAGMAAAAAQAGPLVAAIEEYERDHGEPPPSLEALVPGSLPAIPSTGLGAYPKFDYFTGEDAEGRFSGNPW